MINLILASNVEGIIGKDNDLIWKIPEDLKNFKFKTKKNTVIMGRKTFESIGKPLPDRENIVITRNTRYRCQNCIVVDSMERAIYKSDKRNNIWIIGGSEIYNIALNMDIVDKIYHTEIHKKYEGDKSGLTYFKFDRSNFFEESRDNRYDQELDLNYSFVVYSRK